MFHLSRRRSYASSSPSDGEKGKTRVKMSGGNRGISVFIKKRRKNGGASKKSQQSLYVVGESSEGDAGVTERKQRAAVQMSQRRR